MPSLEDFVEDLYKGKKEVDVPKDKVTELSPGWYVSKLNLPHEGSKGSWRNGRLHAHDMGDHYSVHLDRVDPKEDSFGHMIEDAPMLLFIWTGFRDASLMIHDEEGRRAAVDKSVLPRAVIGAVLLVLGLMIAVDNYIAFGLVMILSILGLIGLGAVFVWQWAIRRREKRAWVNLAIALVAFAMTVVFLFLPKLSLFFLVYGLTLWLLGSGVFLVFGRGDKLQFDQGSVAPLVMGAFSLVLGTLLLFSPYNGLSFIVTLGGVLVAFIGLMQLLSALLIRRAMRRQGEAAAGTGAA